MILCYFTEGAGRNLLNQRKFRHELGVLERSGEEQGTHKWKKGRNYSQSREKPKELLMCNLSPANYGKVTHFLVFIFASYVIACLQKDLEQISLE